MLSYLHEFHAGNHADVFKHAVLTLLIEALGAKPKPMVYVESHAGSGLYDLHGPEATRTGEWQQGIGRFWEVRAQFPELAGYIRAIEAVNPDGLLRWYPGSPRVASATLRAHDALLLMELHKTEMQHLRQAMHEEPRAHLHHRDGFEGLPALLPPRPARGLVLIDPSYEIKSDYTGVARCLAAAHQRWPNGVYAVWYPRLGAQRDNADLLLDGLRRIDPGLLALELAVRPQSEEFGMHASGMAILNPPWQFAEHVEPLRRRLQEVLQDS